jgi:hypothetical protein
LVVTPLGLSAYLYSLSGVEGEFSEVHLQNLA